MNLKNLQKKSEENLAAPQTIRQKSTHAPESEKWKTEKGISEKEKSVDSEKKWKLLSEDSSWIQKINVLWKLCDK